MGFETYALGFGGLRFLAKERVTGKIKNKKSF